MSELTAPSAKCYLVTATEYNHHTDRKGRTKLPTKQAYSAVKEANAAAYSHLLSRYAGTPGEPEGNPQLENKGSETECFRGSFMPLTRDVYEYTVQVVELKMYYPKVPKQRRRGGGRLATDAPEAVGVGTGTGTARGHAGIGVVPVPWSRPIHPRSRPERQPITTGLPPDVSQPGYSAVQLSSHHYAAQTAYLRAPAATPTCSCSTISAPTIAHL